jgi:signal transduction histidine kinase
MSAGAGIVLLPETDLPAAGRAPNTGSSPRWRDVVPAAGAGVLFVLGIAVADATHRHLPGSALVLAVLGCAALVAVSLGLPLLVVRHWSRVKARPTVDIADLLAGERQRLARELHDVGAAAVTAMIVQAAAAATLIGRDDDGVRRALSSVQRLGTTAMTEIYYLVGSLRNAEPEIVDGQHVSAPTRGWCDLDALIADLRSAGLQISVSGLEDAPPLDPEVELAGYRVVQESLTNALKHSVRRDVSVKVSIGSKVTVQISSRGAALDQPVTGVCSGVGLRGLRERVEGVGGRFTVDAAVDRFTVRADLPMRRTPVGIVR